MMTPKEKANELYSKFDNLLNKDFIHPIVYDNQIKKCALLSVDFAREFITGDLNESFDKTMYLFEIKQEIEKL
jgi:hypothetical protein